MFYRPNGKLIFKKLYTMFTKEQLLEIIESAIQEEENIRYTE